MQKEQISIRKVNVVEYKMGTIISRSGSVVVDIVKEALKKLNAGLESVVKAEVLRSGTLVEVDSADKIDPNEELVITLDLYRRVRMDPLVEAVLFSKDNKQLTETVLKYADDEIRGQVWKLEDKYLNDNLKGRAYSQISDDVVGTINRALLDCLQKVKEVDVASELVSILKKIVLLRTASGHEISQQLAPLKQGLNKNDNKFCEVLATKASEAWSETTRNFNYFLMTMNSKVLPVSDGVYTFIYKTDMSNVLARVNSMIVRRGKDTCMIIFPSSQWLFSRSYIKWDNILKKGLKKLNETLKTLSNIYLYIFGFPTDPLDVHFIGRLGKFNRICEHNAHNFGFVDTSMFLPKHLKASSLKRRDLTDPKLLPDDLETEVLGKAVDHIKGLVEGS
ncbi:unnamed protein product [Bursaphelenchus okinawaensis]|uniref:Uncharacterized protein n=1 Tax=Bursaphelenchus okinawaensis TaxID=465554 RepID=A0A811JPQ9_9BILA|nr:unnamed protein product [Bursaphelenchus okinawaensis]CAG9076851.1 unnamed protein product [Bursaphelenchus okinawaensis]